MADVKNRRKEGGRGSNSPATQGSGIDRFCQWCGIQGTGAGVRRFKLRTDGEIRMCKRCVNRYEAPEFRTWITRVVALQVERTARRKQDRTAA